MTLPDIMPTQDADVVEVMRLCRLAGVSVHVRGRGNTHVVIEFLDKRTRQVVGGKEMKRRLAGSGGI